MTDAAPLRNPLHVPGVMRCARCGLVITRTNLYCRDGTAGPGVNETERCLNGCGPLWPMTWEQRARDADAASECLFEEARKLRDEVERLKREIFAAESAYLDGIFQTAARCAQIADEHASVEGIAQQISDAIRGEFLLGYDEAPPE